MTGCLFEEESRYTSVDNSIPSRIATIKVFLMNSACAQLQQKNVVSKVMHVVRMMGDMVTVPL
ncbi:MAG: hypothetical protein HOH50_15425 [Planctomycetaceae bacterium]|nr:hypothetical protein [Planctomycetaceae bacterium]MBT5885606.1 hypothetical protein [Planctomycetaceae bacterium]